VTPEIFPVSAISRAVRGDDGGFMAIFTAYFDASGTWPDRNLTTLTVAGFIARQDSWSAFEKEWRQARTDLGLFGCLHMKHFAHHLEEFQCWKGDEKRRVALLKALADLIGKYTEKTLSLALLLDGYRAANMMFALEEYVKPYPLIASVIVSRVHSRMRENHPADSVLSVFESGDTDQNQLNRLVATDGVPDGVQPIFTKKEWWENGHRMECSPLQACDFIAYEHSKALTDMFQKNKTKARMSLAEIAKKTNETEHPALGFEFCINICRAFNLQMREYKV
jgi:hypothetical protein